MRIQITGWPRSATRPSWRKLSRDQMRVQSPTTARANKISRKALDHLGVGGYDYHPFDPAFPEYGDPQPADLVCCIDVLEHIEPEFLDTVIAELARITVKLGFFTIATGPAAKTLADGRNAHLIQQPSSWWLPKLCAYFEIAQLSRDQHGLVIIVEPRSALRQT